MPNIEYIALCNHAEAVNGLLYLSGAGWTDHWRTPNPDGEFATSHFGIGVSILVPWAETNRRFALRIRVEGEDGEPEIADMDGELELGRPPGLPPGSDLRATLAINVDAVFPSSGGYRITGELRNDPQTRKSVSFRVIDQAPPAS